MARPKEPMALKIAKGKKHLTVKEKSEVEREVYAADGKIEPPPWLKGRALEHFNGKAAYMRAVNSLANRNVYGSVDVEALTLMSLSYVASGEYLVEEKRAAKRGDDKAASAAQRKRIAEDRSYRDFMKLLKLDPGSRVDVGGPGGDGGGEESFDNI